MNEVEAAVAKATPEYRNEIGDWDAVVTAAARRGSRRLLRAAVAATAVAAAVAFALAPPFSTPKHSVLERALAAVGEGPVVHLVLRDEWGGTIVDLRSGRRTGVHGERELWYDPARGLHEVSRFGGHRESDYLHESERIPPYLDDTLGVLALGYRRALESGRARVLAPGEVEGIPVYWIRVHAEWLPDVADGKLHEWAHDVGVSRTTFEPVYLRETRDGKPGPQTGSRVLRMETLPAGAGDFRAPEQPADGSRLAIRFGPAERISPERAAVLLRAPMLSAGPRIGELPLVLVSRLELASRRSGEQDWNEIPAVQLRYGSLDGEGHADIAPARPFVSIQESTGQSPLTADGAGGYVPPEGTALLTPRHGLLRKNGLYVVVEGSSDELVLAAVRALR